VIFTAEQIVAATARANETEMPFDDDTPKLGYMAAVHPALDALPPEHRTQEVADALVTVWMMGLGAGVQLLWVAS
jgi:hypothetical protein